MREPRGIFMRGFGWGVITGIGIGMVGAVLMIWAIRYLVGG